MIWCVHTVPSCSIREIRIDAARTHHRKLTKKACQNVSHKAPEGQKEERKMEENGDRMGAVEANLIRERFLLLLFKYCSDVIPSSINSLVFFCRLTKKKEKLIIRCQQRCRRRLKRLSTRDKRFFFLSQPLAIFATVPIDPLSYASFVFFSLSQRIKDGFLYEKNLLFLIVNFFLAHFLCVLLQWDAIVSDFFSICVLLICTSVLSNIKLFWCIPATQKFLANKFVVRKVCKLSPWICLFINWVSMWAKVLACGITKSAFGYEKRTIHPYLLQK